jgi:hypothetical protein
VADLKWKGKVNYHTNDTSTLIWAHGGEGIYNITADWYRDMKVWTLEHRADWYCDDEEYEVLTEEASMADCMDFAQEHYTMKILLG